MNISDAVALGTVAALLLGYFINATLDRRAKAIQLRTEAYIDLLKGITGCSAYASSTDKHREFSALHMDARARILLYGEAAVIEALDDFWRLGAGFDTEERQVSFLKLITSMRSASGHGSLSGESIRTILLYSVEAAAEVRASHTDALIRDLMEKDREIRMKSEK